MCVYMCVGGREGIFGPGRKYVVCCNNTVIVRMKRKAQLKRILRYKIKSTQSMHVEAEKQLGGIKDGGGVGGALNRKQTQEEQVWVVL